MRGCNGDISYDEGSLQEVRTVTMTMTDVECLKLIYKDIIDLDFVFSLTESKTKARIQDVA